MDKRPIMHIDIPTADCEATGWFYSELFGWEVNHEPTFTWFKIGNIGGGFPDLNSDLAPVIAVFKPGDMVLYVPSDDIDATRGASRQWVGVMHCQAIPVCQSRNAMHRPCYITGVNWYSSTLAGWTRSMMRNDGAPNHSVFTGSISCFASTRYGPQRAQSVLPCPLPAAILGQPDGTSRLSPQSMAIAGFTYAPPPAAPGSCTTLPCPAPCARRPRRRPPAAPCDGCC